MASLVTFVILSSWTTLAFTFPHNTFENILKRSRVDFESSGSGPEEPIRGIVRVVQLDHRALAQSGFFRKGMSPRTAPSFRKSLPFPAFLSQGRPGPAPAAKAPVSPLHHLHPKGPTEMDLKKKQGLQMWQRAMDKGGKLSLPVNLKDMKQTCTAVPFTQRVTADGCETVTVHNKLCFGQCSSLFVPSEGEFAGLGTGTGALHRRAPCSRCAPSKAQTVTVPLRCRGEVREKRVMVVEECKCETGIEERSAEAAASMQL
ncbi:DAN domain family member 5 [Hippoglossus hippoglossus]|uniref:DAN domain family member 5 n=1 Tax=Hippoglossus hippoglossus TaxID=8267 RepID=UPI00148B466A|nr:DAN domain family member 5 [Hippoglossus hippoglossus]XP_035040442.1 DAN domain family member 5 [Hippoglossus stenolepis]